MKLSKFPTVVPQLRSESGLTFEELAREIGCSLGTVMRWKKDRAHNLDAVVTLLRFASERKLRNTTITLMGYLKEACGPSILIQRLPEHYIVTPHPKVRKR